MDVDMVGYERSTKELLSELVRIQVRNEIEGDDEGLIKRIECKLWARILSKGRKKGVTEMVEYINYIDSSLSNMVVQSSVGSDSLERMNAFLSQRPKLVETQMLCFLPLFVLSYDLVDHYYRNPSRVYILQLMYILLGSLDTYCLDFWQGQSLARVYRSDFAWRLNSIMQRNLDREEFKSFDSKRMSFATFSSLIFKSSVFTKDSSEFWQDIISDFALGMLAFKGLVTDSSREGLFDNQEPQFANNLDEIRISRETDRIAEFAFGGDDFGPSEEAVLKGTVGSGDSEIVKREANSDKGLADRQRNKRSSLLASFMGNSDDELEEFEFRLEKTETGGSLDQSQIQSKDREKEPSVVVEQTRETTKMVCSQAELRDSRTLGLSSYSYFDGLSKLIKEKRNEREEEENRWISNLSRVKLPGLLRRVSRRSLVEYNTRYLGTSWDQQYLSLNRTNKIFNESILSVLTTERIKNCTVVSGTDNHSRDRNGCVWIKLDSVMKLYQGLDSEEFSFYPRRQRFGPDRSLRLSDDYSVSIYHDHISLELVKEAGELSPWLNNFGLGDRLIYTRKAMGERAGSVYTKDDQLIFLSQDLVSALCAFGTKVHYLRSFAELLTFLGDKMSSELKSRLRLALEDSNRGSSQTVGEESVASIKILGKVILELLQMYFRDIETCFFRLSANNGDRGASYRGLSSSHTATSSSYLNLCVLLTEFSPVFEMLTKVFDLRSSSSRPGVRTWKIPHGYFLLSCIYSHLWQFQMNLPLVVSNRRHSVPVFQKGIHKKIDTGLHYSNGHILSVIYRCLKNGIFDHKLDDLFKDYGDLDLGLKTSSTLNRSILRCIVPTLLRILVVKKMCIRETRQMADQGLSKTTTIVKGGSQFPDNNLSMFFSDSNNFLDLEESSETKHLSVNLYNKQVPTVSSEDNNGEKVIANLSCEAMMEYLRRNELDFRSVYDVYFKYLNQAFDQISGLEYNVEEYLDLAFEIGEFIGEVIWGGREDIADFPAIETFDDALKKGIQSLVKAKKSALRNKCNREGLGGGELIGWRKDSNETITKQLDNYISVNGSLGHENLLRFIFRLNLDSSCFKRQVPRKGEKEVSDILETTCRIGQTQRREEEEEDLARLFQMLILLEVIYSQFLRLKQFVGRVGMYIWCRKNTTDYNLYIKFSQGYLYDTFSEELQRLVWEIENKITIIHNRIRIIQEYMVMLFGKLDPSPLKTFRNQKRRENYSYDDKWKIVMNFYNGKLFSHLSLDEKIFIRSVTCLVCQICIILSDLASKIVSLKNLPKRPSSFSPKSPEEQDFRDRNHQRNTILELVDSWKSNNLAEIVSRFSQTYESLKSYISENKAIFYQENSHALYYIYS